MAALKHLQGIYPSGRWWIKGDGTDIQAGLQESMRNEWSGDVYLEDGNLKEKHDGYVKYLEFVRGIGVKQRRSYESIKVDLQKQLERMVPERLFLHEGHNKAKETFESKRRLLNVHEDSLFALAWDVEGYAKLLEKSEAIQNSISEILERLDGHPGDRGNIPAVVAVLKKEMELYVKGLTTKKREAASHLFLFMISDEL